MFKFGIVLALALACHGSSVQRSADVNNFLVYRRVYGETPLAVVANAATIAATISPVLKTVFLVHGHQGSRYNQLNTGVRRAILNNEDTTVIVVDWQPYASGSYSSASDNVPLVAASLANFINLFRTIPNFNSPIHIVGFNLGAHVAGIAGRSVNLPVHRITGLDPTGSQWGQNSNRLRATDAVYVEVIHTDGSGLLANGVGTAIGSADFFVNGGSNQPGCLTHSCSHERAYEVFEASFVNPTLVGRRCMSSSQMTLNRCSGESLRLGFNDLTKTGTGTFRINTKRSFPF